VTALEVDLTIAVAALLLAISTLAWFDIFVRPKLRK
jgi:hypothetical protein